MTTRLLFYTDPAEFLAAAGGYLAADPVLSTVVATVGHRAAASGAAPPEWQWWLVVADSSGAVVGAGMRTAPFEPHPLFLLPMPGAAAVELARALHERGEDVRGVNGAQPAVDRCAAELVRLGGGRVEVSQRTRLHELGELVWPAPVPGELRPATEDDADLVTEWFGAFMGDADEQAGRPRGASAHEAPDRTEVLRRIHAGGVWLWVAEDGTPVHFTGVTPPSFGVVRVAPVYTPPAYRGHGWASNAVAAVSWRARSAGARVCLYTDQANPTSNKIYTNVGYRPVADMANLTILDSPGPGPHVEP